MDPTYVGLLSSDSSYASDVSDDGSATNLKEKPKYQCNYCPKSFLKNQALGGHQNAHKKEREIIKRQKLTALANMNKPDLDPSPLPNQYTLPPGFEQRLYNVDGPDNLAMVSNQCPESPSTDFARLKIDTTQGMGPAWALTEISCRPTTAQPQLQPLFSVPSSSVCLDLCLGVGSNSQTQTLPEEPNDLDNKDDDLSLSLSLKM